MQRKIILVSDCPLVSCFFRCLPDVLASDPGDCHLILDRLAPGELYRRITVACAPETGYPVHETGLTRFSYHPLKIAKLRVSIQRLVQQREWRSAPELIVCAGYDSRWARVLAAQVHASRVVSVEHGLTDTLAALQRGKRPARPRGQKATHYAWRLLVDGQIERMARARHQEFWSLLPLQHSGGSGTSSGIEIKCFGVEQARQTFADIFERLARVDPGLEGLERAAESGLALVLLQPLHEMGYSPDVWRRWVGRVAESGVLASAAALVIKNHPRCQPDLPQFLTACFAEYGMRVHPALDGFSSAIPVEALFGWVSDACNRLLTPYSTAALYLGRLTDMPVVTGLGTLVEEAPNAAVASHIVEAKRLFDECLPASRLHHC